MSELKFTDDGIFEISKVLYNQFISEKNLKQLDIDNIDQFKRQYIKPLYPHKQYIQNNVKIVQKYECNEYCCKISPGRYCCCSSTQPNKQYKQFGLGVCLYVKFIKHITLFLFLISILAIISIILYVLVSYKNGYNILQTYNSVLFSTTIGTLSSQSVKCQYSQIVNNIANFQLQCNTGQIVQRQPVYSIQMLSNLINCHSQHRKIDANEYIVNNYIRADITNNSSYHKFNITVPTNIYNNIQYQYISYTYKCINNKYQIGTTAVPLTQNIILYITIGIDLIIIVGFIIFLISENSAQNKQIEKFKLGQLAIHDFTVKISGFHYQYFQDQLEYFINGYDQIKDRYYMQGNSGQSILSNIVQIKIPQAQQIRQIIQSRRQYYQKLYDLIQQCFLQDGIDLNRYKDSSDFIRKCYGTSNAPEYQQYRKQLTQLVQQFMDSKKIRNNQLNQIQFSILMVLSNPKHKKLMLRNAKNYCCTTYIKIGNKKYNISQPPVADMIIWQNKYKHTFIRIIIAWIITFAICFCSYLLVAYAKYKQQQLRSNKFNINCSIFYSPAQLQTYNTLQSALNTDRYLHCYCYYNYFTISYKDPNMRQTCTQWFNGYLIYYLLPILISIGIVIYNIIVSRIYRILSRFQAHTLLSTQLYSYIIKRSFMLIMNMGLIIILIKLNYHGRLNIQNLSFLFMGVYTDITSDWYLEIGVIIILTLGINIMMPIFDMVLVSMIKCIRKCWDRRCFCRKTSQKTKKGYIDLYSNDVFPIEQRYSDFIAMIIITLAFSAVMPILYVISFLSIWFMFICDKLLLFRIYQKPINYTKDLQYNVFKIVYIGLLIHCVASAFMLSQPHLIFNSDNNNNSRFNIILTTPYLIPYVVIFIVLSAWAIFYSTIVKFCKYCYKKCQKQVSKVYKSKFHQNFYGALNQYQINRLKMSVQMQLNNTVSASTMPIQQQQRKRYSKIINQNTYTQLLKAQKIRKQTYRTNNNNNNKDGDQGNIRLIGRAGYEEMFDDQVFYRQRKINSIDYQITDIIKVEKQFKRNLKNNVQNTICSINL